MYLKFLNSSSHWRIRDQLYAHQFDAEHAHLHIDSATHAARKKRRTLNVKRPANWQGAMHYKNRSGMHRVAPPLPAPGLNFESRHHCLKSLCLLRHLTTGFYGLTCTIGGLATHLAN